MSVVDVVVHVVVHVVVCVVVCVVVLIVVCVNVMSWLGNMRRRVVVVVLASDHWVNVVLFRVLVLSGVSGLVVLRRAVM